MFYLENKREESAFAYMFVNGILNLFLMQYQNVFAPLIKLEADYDKVCVLSSAFSPYVPSVKYKHLSKPFVLNFCSR